MVRFAFLILLQGVALAEEPASAPQVESAGSGAAPAPKPVADGEYEIENEEEVAPPEEVAVPLPKRAVIRGKGGGTAVQGSRAKDRFTPILKSETKSVYKKGGKHLDVDPD